MRTNPLKKRLAIPGAVSRGIRCHALVVAVGGVASEGIQRECSRIDILVLWQGCASAPDASDLEPNAFG